VNIYFRPAEEWSRSSAGSAFDFGGCDRRLDNNHNLLIVAVSLSAGLIPAVAPSFYERFPSNFQVIFGSSITSTVIVVFVLNLVFNHWSWRQPQRDDAIDEALSHGAVAVDVPDSGVPPHGGDSQPTG
jgi:uric acid transporter